MDILTVDVLVHRISHMFKIDGSILPFINIFPPIKLQDGRIIDKVALPVNLSGSDVEIAPKDKLEIRIYDDSEETVTLRVSEKSDCPRKSLISPCCPICGAPLVETTQPRAIGRCLNRGCMGQITYSVIMFLSALGISFQNPIRRVMDNLLVRGALTSLSSIFFMTTADLESPTGNCLETQLFLQYVHSVRGSTTVEQLLRGLRVPDWDEKNIKQIADLFAKKQWGIVRFADFLDPKIMAQHKTIDWEPWKQFISVGTNAQVVTELCYILQI